MVNSLVAHSCSGTKAEHGQEWDAEDDTWAYEGTGNTSWQKLHEELQDLYTPSQGITGSKSRICGMHGREEKYIQGVTRLVDITAGGDFLGLCDQRSSCKHVSDFGRLRSYDRLKLRIENNDYWQQMVQNNEPA